MKRALTLLPCFLSIGLLFLSCGYSSPSSGYNGSGSKYRAFVSQDVSGGGVSAGLDIIDAQTDVLQFVNPIFAGATPGMMVVTPNRTETLVFSAADNAFTIINNATEANAFNGSLTLPGATASFVVSPEGAHAYVAVPTARVVGQSPGAIEVVGLGTNTITAEISCVVPTGGNTCLPQVHDYKYLSLSHNGNRLLAFSDNSNSVFVITPSEVGTQNSPIVEVTGFDRPRWAYFSGDDNTAYVVNCGAECGGTQASVEKLDLISNTTGATVGVSAASVAAVDGTTMYLAGTPIPAVACTGQTQATSCGTLSIVDLTSMTVMNSGIVITDGYHSHIAMGANGQLFVGATACTEISLPNPTNEVRGCLSIYNTHTAAVVIPPANGDVTGLQPIANRAVVYLVQNGELQIYDTTTDTLQKTQIDLNGQAVDVKTIDF